MPTSLRSTRHGASRASANAEGIPHMGDLHGVSPSDHLEPSGKPQSGRRARSLDKSQHPRMASELGDKPCLSLPTTPCGSVKLRSQDISAGSMETPGSTAVRSQEEEPRERLPREQGTPPQEQGTPPQDSRKDKAQKSWLRNLLGFLLRPASEEPKEKAGRKVKGREDPPSPPESPNTTEPPAPRKKANRRRAEARDTQAAREQDARGLEAGPPRKDNTHRSYEAPRGPAHRGKEHSSLHHSVPSQSRRHQPEEELRKLDKDAVIQTIVDFLKKVAEVCEKQNAAGNTDGTCPESRPPRRPTSLALPAGVHRPSVPSSSGSEEARAAETLCAEQGDLSPGAVCHRRAGRRAPNDDMARKSVSESKEAVIQMIVKFLQKVGDQYETEQLQAPQPEVLEPNPAPPSKKKAPERKTSLKRVFSFKKQGSEEPKRAVGSAGATSPESRLSRKPTFLGLGLCVGGHRPSIPGVEDGQVPGTLCPEDGELSPVEDRPRRAEEDGAQDGVSESKEAVVQMIVKFLQKVGDQYEIEQLQAPHPQPEVVEPNPAPPSKKKAPERKTSFKTVFSLKKQGSEEPKRAVGSAGATSPESRLSRKPTFLGLGLCVGGHRPSIPSCSDLDAPEYQEPSPTEGGQEGPPETAPQARSHKPERKVPPGDASESKLLITQKLEAFLQEVGDQLGEQIRRHPCLKRYFQELLDSCQARLMVALRSQEAHSLHPNRSPAKGPYQFPFELPNKFAGNSHNVISLLDLLGHYRRRCDSNSQFYREAQQNAASPDIETESPD